MYPKFSLWTLSLQHGGQLHLFLWNTLYIMMNLSPLGNFKTFLFYVFFYKPARLAARCTESLRKIPHKTHGKTY